MRTVAVWHGHHDTLISWLPSIAERRRQIKATKPSHEWATRLRLIKRVKGPLPQGLVDARRAYVDERRAYDDARRAYDDARRAYVKEMKALHSKECLPDCPWDGTTIFPVREAAEATA